MITLFTTPSCTSCRKAKKWLTEHEISYEERNIFHESLTKDEVMQILQLTEEGVEEIISQRSQVYQRLDLDLDNMQLDELITLLQENPTLIRRPIMMDDRRLQIGYNEDDIRVFLSRKVRKFEMRQAMMVTSIF